MDKKIALITGASRGLGAALAEELCPTHHIVAVARTTGALEELDDRIKARGGEATLAPMDITNADAMAHLCRAIHDRWGRADLWAHTAIHAAPLTPAHHIDAKDWGKSVEVNVTAMGHLVPMIGALLGYSDASMALFFDDPRAGQKFFGSYGSTKAAQIALARSWEAEAVQGGTVVRVLTPAPMPTAVRARFFPGEDRSALASPASEARRLLASL
ncbi:SDR family NAD(P)-dependent oxidoreductase [Aliiroseovarius sp. PTFE2010]|uniref:SDR family NAD(P)-dependent oxidoreductase n=1 Tax=Aliiroseovarius sp. PTFE2010 TaxID=3417190 RepID=UPI003CEB6D08